MTRAENVLMRLLLVVLAVSIILSLVAFRVAVEGRERARQNADMVRAIDEHLDRVDDWIALRGTVTPSDVLTYLHTHSVRCPTLVERAPAAAPTP